MTLQKPEGTCYNIAGLASPFDDITYVPCNHTAVSLGQHSACCAPGDKCLTNGLCQYPGNTHPYNEWWRIGCTDPTYKDPSCPQQCAEIEKERGTHLVFQCPGDGKWCCATGRLKDYPERGTMNTTCCSIANLAFDGQEAVEFATARAYVAVKTSSTGLDSSTVLSSIDGGQGVGASTAFSVSNSNQATMTAAPTERASDGGSKPLTLGLAIGLSIPITILLVVAFIFTCRRLERRAQWRYHEQTIHEAPNTPSHLSPHAPPFPPSPSEPSGLPAIHTKDAHAAPPQGIASLYRSLRHRRNKSSWQGIESQEDLRRAHPHAFRYETGGREMPVELDAVKAPVEMWSPTGREKTDMKDSYGY